MLTEKFLLQRITDGKYLDKNGYWTQHLQQARVFNLKHHAKLAFKRRRLKSGKYQIRSLAIQVTEHKEVL